AQYSVVGNLSGGERRRLYLLRILMSEPNVLLLDEPTNDLDIPTLIALEEYLDDFAGALIVVSHDRYFLDRTIDTVFRFEGNGEIREFPGDYSAYLEIVERERASEAETRAAVKAQTIPENAAKNTVEKTESKKLSFNEKRELEMLEAQIPEIEKRLSEIETELNEFAFDAYKVNELFNEQQKLSVQLENNMERWAELAERAG
ncbi:MAG: ATP-binding cassette domain-containing protein, partial [Acidobacteriota bacterium]|nr:ATP-binding cassette domain-containing protein [Acidobacteriota bacterium]